MKLSVDEQIADLRKTGSNRLLPLIRPAAAAIAAGLILSGIASGHFAFFAVAGVAGIIALTAGLPVPHIRNAVKGIDRGWKIIGVIEITVRQWPNEDGAKMESCQGLIFKDNQPLWRMDFGVPGTWQPAAGKYPAQLIFIPGVDWPVVLITEEGVLYPRSKPGRVLPNYRP
jgi:hypothetical protein